MDVVTSAKTDMFRMRINPEVRKTLETVYGKTGLTLTDAINVFFQQSLNVGGFPSRSPRAMWKSSRPRPWPGS